MIIGLFLLLTERHAHRETKRKCIKNKFDVQTKVLVKWELLVRCVNNLKFNDACNGSIKRERYLSLYNIATFII